MKVLYMQKEADDASGCASSLQTDAEKERANALWCFALT